MELLPENHKNRNYNDISMLRSEFEKEGTVRRLSNHDYYYWKLNNNPIKKGICKIVKSGDKAVSMATVTPKKMLFKNKQITCGEIGDTFTSSDFQRKGLFTKLVNSARNKAEEEDIKFIYGTPNHNSLPGYKKKLQFDVIPSLDLFNFLYPIKIIPLLNKKINNKFISIIFSVFISPLLKIKGIFANPYIDKKIKIQLFDEFDQNFDQIWIKEGGKYDAITIRNLDYIKWRFLENPEEYTIYTAKKNNSYIGYIVLKEGRWENLKVGYIADIFTIDSGNQAVFNSLIYYAKKHFISKKFDMISLWLQKGIYTDKLKLFGFIEYKSIPVICYINKFGKDVLSKNINWYFTMSDSDNI